VYIIKVKDCVMLLNWKYYVRMCNAVALPIRIVHVQEIFCATLQVFMELVASSQKAVVEKEDI